MSTNRTTPPTASNVAYRPVYNHWFYKKGSDSKAVWIPFSFSDSMLLEEFYQSKGNVYV